MRTHFSTHTKVPKDKVVLGKIILHTALIVNKRLQKDNEDDPQDIDAIRVKKYKIPNLFKVCIYLI